MHCLAWKMPSNDKCISAVRLSSISHFKMENSDSIDIVLANIVAKPPQNKRRHLNQNGVQAQVSLNVVLLLWLSIMLRTIVSTLYSLNNS